MGLFYGPAEFNENTPVGVIDDHIRTTEIYIAFLTMIMFMMAALSISISLVPGACLGGGAAGVTFSALPHIFWTLPVLLFCFLTYSSVYYGSDNNVASVVSWVTVCCWFHLLLILVNFISMVALILEIGEINSTLWNQNGGAWTIVLLVVTIIYIPLGAWIAWRLYVHRSNLLSGFAYGWRPGIISWTLSMSKPASPPPQATYQPPSAPAVQAPPLPERDDNDDNLASDGAASSIKSRMRNRIHVSGFAVGNAEKLK